MITDLSSIRTEIRAKLPLNKIIFYAYLSRMRASTQYKLLGIANSMPFLMILLAICYHIPFYFALLALEALESIYDLPTINAKNVRKVLAIIDRQVLDLFETSRLISWFLAATLFLVEFINMIPIIRKKYEIYHQSVAPQFWQNCEHLAKDDLVAFVKQNNYYLSPDKTLGLLSLQYIKIEYRMLDLARQMSAPVISRALDKISKDRSIIVMLLQSAYQPNSSMYNLPVDIVKKIVEFSSMSNIQDFKNEVRNGFDIGVFHSVCRFASSPYYSVQDHQHLTYFYDKHKQSLFMGINKIDSSMRARKTTCFTPGLDMQKKKMGFDIQMEWDIEAAMMVPATKHKSGYKLKTQ